MSRQLMFLICIVKKFIKTGSIKLLKRDILIVDSYNIVCIVKLTLLDIARLIFNESRIF